jgi:hypothetical protein
VESKLDPVLFWPIKLHSLVLKKKRGLLWHDLGSICLAAPGLEAKTTNTAPFLGIGAYSLELLRIASKNTWGKRLWYVADSADM